MTEIIGTSNCPMCGEQVDVKINKNRKLYAYCDYGCAIKFNAPMSKLGLAELARGKKVKLGNIVITPKELKGKENDGLKSDDRGNTTGRWDSSAGTTTRDSGTDNGTRDSIISIFD